MVSRGVKVGLAVAAVGVVAIGSGFLLRSGAVSVPETFTITNSMAQYMPGETIDWSADNLDPGRTYAVWLLLSPGVFQESASFTGQSSATGTFPLLMTDVGATALVLMDVTNSSSPIVLISLPVTVVASMGMFMLTTMYTVTNQDHGGLFQIAGYFSPSNATNEEQIIFANEICAVNMLNNCNLITPGEQLLIPRRHYTVQAGDFLAKIAPLFGTGIGRTTVADICGANMLADCNIITPGEDLIIPYEQ